MRIVSTLVIFLLIPMSFAISGGPGVELEPRQVAQPGSVEESVQKALDARDAKYPQGEEPQPANGSSSGKGEEEKKAGDPNVRSAEISDNVIVQYSQKTRLFGFIPLSYTLTTEAFPEGRVAVRFPWWLVAASTDTTEVSWRIEDAINAKMNSYPTAPDDEERKERLLDAILAANRELANTKQ